MRSTFEIIYIKSRLYVFSKFFVCHLPLHKPQEETEFWKLKLLETLLILNVKKIIIKGFNNDYYSRITDRVAKEKKSCPDVLLL